MVSADWIQSTISCMLPIQFKANLANYKKYTKKKISSHSNDTILTNVHMIKLDDTI